VQSAGGGRTVVGRVSRTTSKSTAAEPSSASATGGHSARSVSWPAVALDLAPRAERARACAERWKDFLDELRQVVWLLTKIMLGLAALVSAAAFVVALARHFGQIASHTTPAMLPGSSARSSARASPSSPVGRLHAPAAH
jgi:hypothetical protein